MTGAALGGALGDWLGWRSVFWVLAAIYVTAGGALFGVMRAHPDLARPASGHRVDDRPDDRRCCGGAG